MLVLNKLLFKAVILGCLVFFFTKTGVSQKISVKHKNTTVCSFEISQNTVKDKAGCFNIEINNKTIKVYGGLQYKDLYFNIPSNDTIVFYEHDINELKEISLDSNINYIYDKKKNSRKHILKAGVEYGMYFEIPKNKNEILINNLILYPKKVLNKNGSLKIDFYEKFEDGYKKKNESDIIYPLKYFKHKKETELNILKKTIVNLSNDFILCIKIIKISSDYQVKRLSEPMLKLKGTKDKRRFLIRINKEYGWLEQKNIYSFGLKLGYK